MRRINIFSITVFAIMCIASSVFGQSDMVAKIGVSGQGVRDYVILGMIGDATDGFDNAFDAVSFGGNTNNTYVETFFSHPEWGQVQADFRSDIRALKPRDQWTVSLYTNVPAGTMLTIRLLDASAVPSGYALTVQDGATMADLMAGSYQFPVITSGAVRDFTVTATFTAPQPALPTVPGAPLIGTATAGDARASVSFSAPASDGGSAILGYTVTSSPGGKTATGTSSPIIVTGLKNGTAYKFTVTARNAVGTGAPSAASNTVTPKKTGGK